MAVDSRIAAMIDKAPPQFGQCSRSISKTRLSNRAQLMCAEAMQTKSLRVNAAVCSGGCHGGWRGGEQAQYLLPGAWSERDTVGAGRRLQGAEGVVRIGIRQIGHALLFDQIAKPCESSA